MALVEQAKKGGRYTKKEQEQRKIEVYHLHFEENKSAVKIAELLNVSRNTINEDIHYWHKQVASEFQAQDLTAKMRKQIQRMEIQRDRLLDDLEQAESLDERIRLERFIAEIDNRLTQLYSKMISNGITNLEPYENPEEIAKAEEKLEIEVKDFVRYLILRDENPKSEDLYSENQLRFDFINKTKCNVSQADKIIEKMKSDGLVLCEQPNDHESAEKQDIPITLKLAEFANMRGYLTNEEFGSRREKRALNFQKTKKRKEESFVQKYGPKNQWSRAVRRKFKKYLEKNLQI